MAAPVPAIVQIDQNRDFDMTVLYLQPNGSPVDVTGYTATFAVAQDYGDTPMITRTNGDGITIVGASGSFAVNIPASMTNIPQGTYVCELEVVSPTGKPKSLIKGAIPLSPKVAP